MLTQQQIIALAVEAGLAEVTDTAESLPVDYVEALAKFAQLAAQQERNARQAAQLELEQYRNEAQRRAGVLIKEAYQRGVRDERNACLAEIETGIWMDKTTEEVLVDIADAIRARGEPCRFCNGTGERDSGGSQPWGAAILVQCECQQADDSYRNGVRDGMESAAKVCETIYTNGDGAEGWLAIAADRIRARGHSCPPCNHNCNQGRDCPGAKR